MFKFFSLFPHQLQVPSIRVMLALEPRYYAVHTGATMTMMAFQVWTDSDPFVKISYERMFDTMQALKA